MSPLVRVWSGQGIPSASVCIAGLHLSVGIDHRATPRCCRDLLSTIRAYDARLYAAKRPVLPPHPYALAAAKWRRPTASARAEARPRSVAIARIDQPAFSPAEISHRSIAVNIRRSTAPTLSSLTGAC